MNQFAKYVTEKAFVLNLSKTQIDAMKVIAELSGKKSAPLMKYARPGHMASLYSLMRKGIVECDFENEYKLTEAGYLLIPVLIHAGLWPSKMNFTYAANSKIA